MTNLVEAKQTPEIRAIGAKLKQLGEDLANGKIDRKLAGELANIYGKELKAQQLQLAERAIERDIALVPSPALTGGEVRQIK